MRSVRRLPCLAFALIGFAPSLIGGSFSLTSLPFIANALNNSGEIVGISGPGGETTSAAVYIQGSITYFRAPGSTDTQALSVNNGGQITGWYTATGGPFSYIYTSGQFTTIAVPGALAQAINDSGEVAGWVGSSQGPAGFLFDGVSYSLFRVPGAQRTYATGLDNAGDIVG
jgi:hypothetical protein